MDKRHQDALDLCEKVLNDNRRGAYTAPAGKVYPHQWLWDSCFIAIGLRHLDIARARQELTSLLRGQWQNGMLPNMVFDPGIRYAFDRWFWKSKSSPSAPKNVATSGITQPPMLAEAVVQVGDLLHHKERIDWYRQMFEPLVAYHQWLYQERDPNHTGLAVQIHAYESGLDNTPPWVAELHAHHRPWWLSIVPILPTDFIINRFRRDIRHLPKSQRISNIDALLYIDILWRFRRKNYRIKEILPHDKYLVEDLTFNCILIRANKHLQTIASTIDKQLPTNLKEAIKRSESALAQLWDPESEAYYSRSFNSNRLIKLDTIAGLMPLYSGAISQTQARLLASKLSDEATFSTVFAVPSVPLDSNWFDAARYWQGPTWINTNWLIIQGLREYGFDQQADKLTATSLELIHTKGAYEYFSPLDGAPSGAANFSWTAALTIDLLRRS